MANTKPTTLILGYDLDKWSGYGEKIPVTTPITQDTNSHMLICGMSGSGKSYQEQSLFAKLVISNPQSKFYFSDYKGDDNFGYLRNCERYYFYKNTLNALDVVYDILNRRLAGDTDRSPITLIWDEYMANILALTNADKKLAAETMNRVSEILLMGRSMGVRLICSCQRPDAVAFPIGSRLNYGVIIVLGAYIRSIYEMLMPDHKEQVEGRTFGRGEGVVLLQGSELRFIKIPSVRDYERMKQLCIQALS